jgi:hypothetical protein
MGETAAIVCVPSLRIKKQNKQLKTTGSNTPSTTYVHIEGTQQFPPLKMLTPEDGHIGRNM